MKRGFTLLEIIIAVSVILIISSVIFRVYSIFNSNVAIKNNAGRIASIIYKAKSDTLASRGGMEYGVHFETSKVVLFAGPVYSSGSVSNQNFPNERGVTISSINLTGGGSDLVFHKLLGTTDQAGSITLQSAPAGAPPIIIHVSESGIVKID